MRFDVITIFPKMLNGFFAEGILHQAQLTGKIEIHLHNLRDFTDDLHRTVDDRPYGGGPGMVMKVQPLFRAVKTINASLSGKRRTILLSSQGKLFRQADALRLATYDGLILLCGRYEGVDERVISFVDEEISIGDYVLTGGEIAAAVLIETVARLIPGVVGRFESVEGDSFYNKRHLGPPQYTRPRIFQGLAVPEVLLSGDHSRIETFREEQAWRKTAQQRPDILGIRGHNCAEKQN
ncbi:tRNA (guanosine(37)-N1)-methyltransferase TrmD [Candidatus Acetothermia bacterium]|nr:tRNA (guanosine(37)-N1)-methyltransferase TrmD [Candidatus Acetothermia bacterium]MCI2427187.1 tRNA (guanosine(37)-N1)-methyltransferase TrmD [Candidatus Acetothermia bacterium]MCI2428013.1 tRNA (guanosine(37)-N1)-methyltransferase TrmD [Candidatus Acetothermia bacterium]